MHDAHHAVGTQDLNTSPGQEFSNSTIQRVLSKAAVRIFGQRLTLPGCPLGRSRSSLGHYQVCFFFLTYTFPVHMQQVYGEEIKNDSTPQLVLSTGKRVKGRKEEEEERKGGWRKGWKRTREREETKKKKKESNQPATQTASRLIYKSLLVSSWLNEEAVEELEYMLFNLPLF